jgi:hypothetical protein
MANLNDLQDFERNEFYASFEAIKDSKIDAAYQIKHYSKNGLRVLIADRKCVASDKLNMAFGGGSYWSIGYYEVSYKIKRDLGGDLCAELCLGRKFGKSANGTEIPQSLNKKSEVLELSKMIGL